MLATGHFFGTLSINNLKSTDFHINSGEIWLGLDRLHQLTNSNDYKLKITMTDFNSQQYVAVYEDFKARHFFLFSGLLVKTW